MNIYIFILSALLFIILFLTYYIYKKVQRSQMKSVFLLDLLILFIICLFLILQFVFNKYLNIPLIFFENFIYIGNCALPITLFFTGYIFANTKIKFKKSHLLLFIIPILSLLVVWTNNWHHLFYINYSINLNETTFGPYANVHRIYTYVFLFLGLFYLIKYSIKNAGFFSKQSILIVVGSIVPILINILGTYNIVPMTIYLTPISFVFTLLCYAFAIFKFQFLRATPIALQRIVDRISDGYMVLNENNIIIDFNETFIHMFKLNANKLRNQNLLNILKDKSILKIDIEKIKKVLAEVKGSSKTYHFSTQLKEENKYFNVEINSIYNDKSFLGILILFKDITQHTLDMQTIENKQDMLVEKERLASLGQMIGGIAHNLKTPIMSIAGATEGLNDLIREYSQSIKDPEVTVEDHISIANDMSEWVGKIKEYTSYMSDVITAVKGQAVNMNDEESASSFTIDELLKRVNILMKHELKNSHITLNLDIGVDPSTTITGNINSLVQVVNNMIANAIQSYGGQENKNINLRVDNKDNKLIISIEDFGCGMSKETQNKLFKEMITTKGKNGTGLGLFMSYSTIKGHFNGDITFTSEEGKGTTFNIVLPQV